MIRRPPRSTRTDTLFPYTTLFRSADCKQLAIVRENIRRDLEVVRGGDVLVHAPGQVVHGAVAWAQETAFPACRQAGLGAGREVRVGRAAKVGANRSEEHTSELQSLMRISYAVFCLTKKKYNYTHTHYTSNVN